MTDASPPVAWLACLCAAWCRVCDDYARTLAAVASEFPGLRVRWIDVEDEAALVDDADVETFPTILVGDAQRLWFAGPVMPQPDVLRRLLVSLLRSPPEPVPAAGPYAALADRLRESVGR